MEEKNYFIELNKINVNEKTEKKNGLTYLSWAWAWGEVKKLYPDANYKVYETTDGINYFNDGRTGWVKTGVIINGIEHIEYLPIMDFKNKSIPLEQITSFDVNKTIQRSLTKAVARHGLGLYIYAGEDLPEEETQEEKPKAKETTKIAKNKDFQVEEKEIITSQKETPKNAEEIDFTEAFKRAIPEKDRINDLNDKDLPFYEEEKINVLEQLQDAIVSKCEAIKKNPIDCYNYYCKQFKVKSVDELDSTQLMKIANDLDEAIERRKGVAND